ncbi:mannitol dehydrogenase family protein [Glaciecola sp. 2405UD65-10]|uniref:mannitol dehydrogenase family protein n=1 Tax=Glaciecola sp. 2405UD65-10 TaxID=3397244 RepID=UPI003B5C1C2C
MATRLHYNSLSSLAAEVQRPCYNRDSLSPGIVHIGVGNFHRAHQAMYMHKLFTMEESLDWAIVGAGTKSYDKVMRDKLISQDYLTTVVELDAKGLTAQICASMINFIEDDEALLIEALCQKEIRIVSLTITEGGYYMDDKTGSFDINHPDIQHDIANFDAPKSVFGILIKALEGRRANNVGAFTVMSCDNIPHNGKVAKRAVIEMAAQINGSLAQWIEQSVSFPNSMVDCITPATSDYEKQKLQSLFGIEDKAPVFCEPFRQWVLEDNFVNGRPALEKVGVEFVDDVAPYELMKLRILNGGHASIAYPAALMGIQYVHDVMANETINQYLAKLINNDIIPSLPSVPGVDFNDYFALIQSRFANPEVKDTVPRLCMDASNRLPKFILPIIQANLDEGRDCKGLALVVALWCRMCAEGANAKGSISINDPQAERLINNAVKAKQVPTIFLQMNDIFGDLGNNGVLQEHFAFWLNLLWEQGTVLALETYLQE